MENMEETIQAILTRNARVEAEKAWEVSITRRLFLFVLTYATACLLFWMIGEEKFYVDALVPSGAYLLSTLSLPWLKRWWMRQKGL